MENHPQPQLAETINKINLQILGCGYATIHRDRSWTATITNPVYSRLYYILDGDFTVTGKDGAAYTLAKGGCYLLPAGFTYHFFCEEWVEQVYFHLRLLDWGGLDILRVCPAPIAMPFPEEQASALLLRMKSQSYLDSLKIRQQVLDTVHDLVSGNQIVLRPQTYSQLVLDTMQYIESNLSAQLTTGDLAKNGLVAASTLTRRFRQETGMSMGQYINEQIMTRAERLLRGSTMSVLQISEQFGFCDQFYFSRKFREKFGVSPREYRKAGII